ncbi:MAG TPA: DUF1810 domain-containing protein [Jatrophihabitans sp.]|nr:DUF1810 domain-containing protein [Jatrophihabitans sp.]
MDGFELDRFVLAQNGQDSYRHALAELGRGRKTSHWMWFVFPQLAGLGRSSMAQRYAISSLAEARAYLAHPVLGPRLLEVSSVLLGVPDRSAEEIFGGIDAIKLRSSMTLFTWADPTEPVFGTVLDKFFDGQPDPATDRLLAGGS